MKLRIIKQSDCSVCETYLPKLEQESLSYEIFDADNPGNQTQLDSWNISELPVVQVIDEHNNVLFQFPPGAHSPRVLRAQMRRLSNG